MRKTQKRSEKSGTYTKSNEGRISEVADEEPYSYDDLNRRHPQAGVSVLISDTSHTSQIVTEIFRSSLRNGGNGVVEWR